MSHSPIVEVSKEYIKVVTRKPGYIHPLSISTIIPSLAVAECRLNLKFQLSVLLSLSKIIIGNLVKPCAHSIASTGNLFLNHGTGRFEIVTAQLLANNSFGSLGEDWKWVCC